MKKNGIRKTDALHVKKEYLNNTKIANFISTHPDLTKNTLLLKTLAKKNIFVTVDLDADRNVTLTDPDITQYDLAVMDSVYTLYAAGTDTFTPGMVARVMSGNLEQDVTKQKMEAVTAALRKLSRIRITIDCTDELIARGELKEGQTARMTSYLMPVKEAEVLSANLKTYLRGYHLLEKPVLYEYAEDVRQLISVPTQLLCSDGVSDTDDIVVMKRALIRRIEAMKSSRNSMRSDIIAYDREDRDTGVRKGLFATLGYDPASYSNWPKKRSQLHASVLKLLDGFVSSGYITSYEVVKAYGSRAIAGVRVVL